MTVKSKRSVPQTKRILIVDDHPMMREGLRSTIKGEPDLEICGEAEDAKLAVEALKKSAPDLVLMDITLPGKSGLELIKDIRVTHPNLPILVLSMHDESLYAERALRAGAGGYITKQQSPAELISAIRQVMCGQTYVSRQISEKILKLYSGRQIATTSPLETLTDREFEVFRLIGDGRSTAQIAPQLHLSPKTVAVHYANIRRKLKLESYSDLIRYAVLIQECQNLTN
jgi:DNA-binding NarL/FixJ family response regulator